MSTVKYLGTEIDVRPGTSSSGETAFIREPDRVLRCFLGGLAEAKTYLRERKNGRHYGPRQASWEVTLEDSGCVSFYRSREHALENVAYFAAQDRIAKVTRIEYCPHPGCDGHGEISYRKPRAMFSSERPCPHHDEPERVPEPAE